MLLFGCDLAGLRLKHVQFGARLLEGHARLQATNGRVAYMHVPDTAISGLIMFDKYLSAQAGKDALIVDERYNGGGFIPDFFTEKLQRTLLNVISPRDGRPSGGDWPIRSGRQGTRPHVPSHSGWPLSGSQVSPSPTSRSTSAAESVPLAHRPP